VSTEAFISEITIFAGDFAIFGTQYCDGSVLPIAQNETLYSLIGNTFGGDGRTTFALPDLRGALPTGEIAKNGEIAKGSDPAGVPVSMLINVQGLFPTWS